MNEIFYSLQGEGVYAGAPAVFVRLSGCNRACAWCDTDFAASTPMSIAQVVEAVTAYPARHVVLTGGEPALQVTPELIDALHEHGLYVQIETNGTLPVPDGIDWVTCSPKEGPWMIGRVDELKVVFDGRDVEEIASHFSPQVLELQPCFDAATGTANTADTVAYILEHPHWRLSLQTHRMLGIR